MVWCMALGTPFRAETGGDQRTLSIGDVSIRRLGENIALKRSAWDLLQVREQSFFLGEPTLFTDHESICNRPRTNAT